MRKDFIDEIKLVRKMFVSEKIEILNAIEEIKKELINKDCKFKLPTAYFLDILLDTVEKKVKSMN